MPEFTGKALAKFLILANFAYNYCIAAFRRSAHGALLLDPCANWQE
jgi:hypothetical protein